MKRLITICLVLVLCVPAMARKTTQGDDSAAIAVVDGNVDSLLLLTADVLATNKVGGDVFYVDSTASGGSGTGFSWTNAKLTIETGAALCTAGAGDWVMVSPAHVETAGTAFVDLDKNDVTVWGISNGTRMPTLSYDTTTDTFIIGATGDGVKVHGIKFIATIDSIVFAIVVEDGCTDFIIEDCVFKNETTTTDEFDDVIKIHGTAANNGIIRRNIFEGDKGANSDPQSSINFEDAHFLQIYDNQFSGDIAVAHIQNETAASNFVTIRDNTILCGYIGGNLDTTPGITLFATTTGWIVDNFIVTNVATPELSIVADDCYLAGNYYTETQGTAASLLIGTANQKSGTYIIVTSAVTSSNIPNNTQSAAAVTGAAVGTLLLIEVYGNTGATTGLEGPTNFEMSVDNVAGLTGVDAPIWTEAEAGLDNDIVWQATADATTSHLPLQLESGKKFYIHGDNGVGTGGGTCNFTLVFQRITDGAHITGNDGPS